MQGIERARQAAETAEEAFQAYVAKFGSRHHSYPGFDEAEYLRLMRDAESASGAYCEWLYGTQ